MTSIYRQIGTGAQALFHLLLMRTLRLDSEQANWRYEVPQAGGKTRFLTMDGRIDLADVVDDTRRTKVKEWLLHAAEMARLPGREAHRLRGAVFEVRQGYKSKDAKRQNADIGNAASAYIAGSLPVLVLMSSQIDSTLLIVTLKPAGSFCEVLPVLIRQARYSRSAKQSWGSGWTDSSSETLK
ncbi:MAG: hypothetical protein QM770_05190 [Tepidisphaeraceae bacterium]